MKQNADTKPVTFADYARQCSHLPTTNVSAFLDWPWAAGKDDLDDYVVDALGDGLEVEASDQFWSAYEAELRNGIES